MIQTSVGESQHDEDEEDVVDHRKRIAFSTVSLAIFGYLTWMAYEMPLGEATDPGPGLFPLLVGVIGIIASTSMLLESWIKIRSNPSCVRFDRTHRATWIYIIYVVIMAMALPFFGVYIAGPIFAIGCVRTIGNISWPKSLVYGIIIGVAVSFLAVDVLDVGMQSWPDF